MVYYSRITVHACVCYDLASFYLFFLIICDQVAGDRKNCYLHHTGKGVNINLAIWDTAGQERFKCVSPVSVKYMAI